MTNYGWGGVPVDAYYGGNSPAPSNVPPGLRLVPSDPDTDESSGVESMLVAENIKCAASNSEGRKCKAWAKKGEKYCGIHLRQMKAQEFLDDAVAELDG